MEKLPICRCQSRNHMHELGQCLERATESDGYCKECHDAAASEALLASNFQALGGPQPR